VQIRLGLLVKRNPAVARAVVTGAIEEAAAIWSDYGVSVVEIPAPPSQSWPADAVLSVELSNRPIPGAASVKAWETNLGAIRFTKDGSPTNQIQLFYPGVMRLATMLGVRDRLASRMAGRVLAHEIGHYLLRSPRHATGGLMVAVHRATELASTDRRLFALATADVDRLRGLWLLARDGPASGDHASASGRHATALTGASLAGRQISISSPPPSRFLAAMLPPYETTIRCAIDRPKPRPPDALGRDSDTR
jgi:hypothetical protein